ncbi:MULTISPECIES: hypothetical protein [unclassified Chitinophaga]|uniref:hypothetical protein n=1 Tax=unclassified Chitinophaga TaxID=2619133 RepID=UPI0009D0E2B3|nr:MULTISPECIES: hypothetical protein [unclassified Chitinophaga]OMP75155.1 hypothetical protein BW716_31645 [[Flexibacter] sp. ATCC 35208]WPV63881.1 hypothetical protein QQL36_18955 [Chitinophaga sp. LS1]
MPQYIDSYYLVDNRSSEVVYDLFTNYGFIKEELAGEYIIPQYSSEPTIIFYSDVDLLNYCDENLDCDYLIYWGNEVENSIIRQITLRYTNDGKMIFGISIVGREVDSDISIAIFKDVKNYLNARIGCITGEAPPPSNSIEFIEFCNKRYVPAG